jgi:hypothetical protein
MTVEDTLITQAEQIGREHGVNAAGWYFDGNTDTLIYERTLKGLAECDPMVLDSFPQSPLSGEWADSFSVKDLCDELGYDMDDEESHAWDTAETVNEICSAYEDGFHSAVSRTIESACLDYLRGAGVEVESL